MPGRFALPARPSERAAFPSSALLLLFAVAVVVYLFNVFRYRDYLLDDTFISLRYAKNLVEGLGLVFNPGERVEGYTNFLFVMLAAGFIAVGIDPVVATKWLAVAAAVWTMYLVVRLERLGSSRTASAVAPPIALLLLLPLQAFAYWSVCGMETMLFTALLLCAISLSLRESITRRGHGSAFAFVLLALTRPEGVLCFALCSVAFFAMEYRRDRSSRTVWRYVANAVVFLAAFGAYFAWRYQYYGQVLPNTFYAKVTGGSGQLASGLFYFRDWAFAFPLLAATLALPVTLLSRRWRDALSATAFAAAPVSVIVLAYALYVIAVGGDFMVFFRFFFPIMPLCCVLLAWLMPACAAATSRRVLGAVVVVAWVLHSFASFLTEQPFHAFIAHQTAAVGEVVGRWMGASLTSGDLIAVNPAGAVPYYSNLPAIDMLGLTDETIARRPVFIISPGWAGHRRGWGEYVLERRPRIIFWYNTAGSREPHYLGDHELADNPFFRFFYQLKTMTLPAPGEGAREQVVERFLGFPFGSTRAGEARWGELGLVGEFSKSPIPMTTVYAAPIVVNYFERDTRDESLWELKEQFGSHLDGFVAAVSARWLRTAAAERDDPDVRAQTEAISDKAHRMIEAGDYAGAGRVLTAATQRNETAHSPLVFQYIANLAVTTSDLFTAISAQKEALRLAPGNPLYQRNLSSLLTVAYKKATKPSGSRASGREGSGDTEGAVNGSQLR